MTARRLLIHRCFGSLSIFFGSVEHEIDIRGLSDLDLMKFELILISHDLSLLI